jgi:hypothetical protein
MSNLEKLEKREMMQEYGNELSKEAKNKTLKEQTVTILLTFRSSMA